MIILIRIKKIATDQNSACVKIAIKLPVISIAKYSYMPLNPLAALHLKIDAI
jgi:hypothetical protein